MRVLMQGFVVASVAILATGCLSNKFDTPQRLGGKWVSAKTLNLGHDTYMNNCLSCHGEKGDGMGPAAQGSLPSPRNFQQGVFKFQNVALGSLPRDEDLKRTIRYGLHGTGMLPWDLSDERLEAVTQYIKTFSPKWKEGKPGDALAATPDPWTGKEQEAIAQGRKVYHGIAQCFSCHPAYSTLPEISQWSKEFVGTPIASLRENPHLGVPQDSEYGHKFMPPDFTKNFIRSGMELEDIYRIVGAGVNGTAMPSWKGMLSPSGNEEDAEKNLWAVAHYVKSLSDLKFNAAERQKLLSGLKAAQYGVR